MTSSIHSEVEVKDSIATKLLKVVFSIYFVLTVTVTLIHMGAEYSHTKDTVVEELKIIQQTFEPVLATAIWDMNVNQLKSTFLGMVKFPIILGVKIENQRGKTLGAAGTIINQNGEAMIQEKKRPWIA